MTKRITLTCDVADKDAEEVVVGARRHFPTWKIETTDIDSEEGYYRAKLLCHNCSYIWVEKFPQGSPVPKEYTCPNCKCKTRR